MKLKTESSLLINPFYDTRWIEAKINSIFQIHKDALAKSCMLPFVLQLLPLPQFSAVHQNSSIKIQSPIATSKPPQHRSGW
jgi:hypothetical protein